MPINVTTPETIEAIRKGITAGKTAQEVADSIGYAKKSVLRIARNHKMGTWVKASWRGAVPADFEEVYFSRQVADTAAHYGVGRSTILRWSREKGIARPKPQKKEKPAKALFTIDMHRAFKPASGVVHKEDTAAGDAQRYLQGEGYIPVFRSDNLGREPKPRGRFWRCGRRVLTDAEIVALAAEVRERRERRLSVGRGY